MPTYAAVSQGLVCPPAVTGEVVLIRESAARFVDSSILPIADAASSRYLMASPTYSRQEARVKLRRPRRIFRSGSTFSSENLVGRVIAFSLGVASFGVVLMVALPADLFGHASDKATSLTADASQVAVVDGDTLRLRDVLIRLRGIEAPARGQACRSSTADNIDCGTASSAALASLVRNRRVMCQIGERDRRGFAVAMCEAGGINLNRAMVADGWARAAPADPALQAIEAEARQAARGLWLGTPAPPL